MSESTPRTLSIDINVKQWPGTLRALYRDKVGVNPQYALASLMDAFEAADAEADQFDEDPPDNWLPRSLLNLPEKYILGFIYIAERRRDATLRWRELLDGTSYEAIVEAVFACFMEAVSDDGPEEQEADDDGPFEESDQTTPPSPPSRTVSRSPSFSTGRSTTRASSPSKTSKRRSAKRTPCSKR